MKKVKIMTAQVRLTALIANVCTTRAKSPMLLASCATWLQL